LRCEIGSCAHTMALSGHGFSSSSDAFANLLAVGFDYAVILGGVAVP
jgi:hypothetical protein